MRNLRLIFTSDGVGVGVGVVFRSAKLYDLVKTALSESQAEAEQLINFQLSTFI